MIFFYIHKKNLFIFKNFIAPDRFPTVRFANVGNPVL